MFNYLLNYGINLDIEDVDVIPALDIDDRTILQEQINNTRNSYFELIKVYDLLQKEYLETKNELNLKVREMNNKYEKRIDITKCMSTDIDYIELNEKIEAIKEAMKTVSNQLDFIKGDMKILTNSMYNK